MFLHLVHRIFDVWYFQWYMPMIKTCVVIYNCKVIPSKQASFKKIVSHLVMSSYLLYTEMSCQMFFQAGGVWTFNFLPRNLIFWAKKEILQHDFFTLGYSILSHNKSSCDERLAKETHLANALQWLHFLTKYSVNRGDLRYVDGKTCFNLWCSY